jgi:hypothetical protein
MKMKNTMQWLIPHSFMFGLGCVIPFFGPMGFSRYLKYESGLGEENTQAISLLMVLVQGCAAGVLLAKLGLV